MEQYGKFKERGYTIEAYIPTNDTEPNEFLLTIRKGKFKQEHRIPMLHRPTFGVDIDDKQTLEEKMEEILKTLP